MISSRQRVLGQDEQVRQPQPAGIRIPVVITVTALIFVGLFIATASFVIMSRSPHTRFDPFAAYASVLPGQPRANAEAYGFDCDAYSADSYNTYYSDHCFLQPADGVFSRVVLSIDDNRIGAIIFTPRKGTLSLGDAALVLGAPQTMGPAHFTWNEDSMSAYVPTNAGRFNYHVPILNISVH